jgi:hypothetical protein
LTLHAPLGARDRQAQKGKKNTSLQNGNKTSYFAVLCMFEKFKGRNYINKITYLVLVKKKKLGRLSP